MRMLDPGTGRLTVLRRRDFHGQWISVRSSSKRQNLQKHSKYQKWKVRKARIIEPKPSGTSSAWAALINCRFDV